MRHRVTVTQIALLLVLAPASLSAQDTSGRTYDLENVTPDEFAGDVRDLPQLPSLAALPAGPRPYRPLLAGPPDTKILEATAPAGSATLEAPELPLAPMPGPLQNFAGLSLSE